MNRRPLASYGGAAAFDNLAAMTDMDQWFKEHQISEVEALLPDVAGSARGKFVPIVRYSEEEGIRMPEAMFIQTVTGDYAHVPKDVVSPADIDMRVLPDPDTIRLVPWAPEPTAQIIHDCFKDDGAPIEIAPRYVLRRVLNLYDAEGWEPVVAPEIEFYLVQRNIDPDYPLAPPVGRSGRPEPARKAFSIDAVNEFEPLFEDIYDFAEAQDLQIETLTHEDGVAQMEVNFEHGNAMELADQMFLFKRTVREAALRHDLYATFMAKPLQDQPGSSMHLHQSLADKSSGENLFGSGGREINEFLLHFIGGLQKYLPSAMSMFAPNVNSYRRIARYHSAPINTHWGRDNRTAGFRVPNSDPEAMRVENRVAGSDVNPYLMIAASLAAGYLGLKEKLQASEPLTTSAYELPYGLPRSLEESLRLLKECKPLAKVLGGAFVQVYAAIKQSEYEAFFRVISSWEREHLLLNI